MLITVFCCCLVLFFTYYISSCGFVLLEMETVEHSEKNFLIFFSVNSCVRCVCDLLQGQNFFWLFLGSVFCVHVSSQKSIAVSGGQDDVAYVWSLQTGNTVFKCTGRLSSVTYF